MNTFKAFFSISRSNNCPLAYERGDNLILTEQALQLTSGRPGCLVLTRTLIGMLPDLRPHADTYFVGIEGESFSCGGCTGQIHFHITDRLTQHVAAPGMSLGNTLALIGKVDVFPLAEVLQVMNMHQKTGQLVVEFGKRDTGFFAFRDGGLVAARYGMRNNEQAFYAMLMEKKGFFRFLPELPDTLHNAKELGDFMTILMEGLRRMDEQEDEEEEDLMELVQRRQKKSR